MRCGSCTTIFNGFASLSRGDDKDSGEPALNEHREVGSPSSPAPAESSPLDRSAVVSTQRDAHSESLTAGTKKLPLHSLHGRLDETPPLPIWTPADDDCAVLPAPPLAASDAGAAASDDAADTEAGPGFGEPAEQANALEETADGNDQIAPPVHVPRADPILFRPDLYEQDQAKRGKWMVAGLVLALLLGGQAIFLLRSEIAAHWPQTKWYLTALCSPLGCKIDLPRRIDQLTIEASELQADPRRPNVVHVTAIIRNRGTTPQAYPSLEITLTDTLDRALARRSLEPLDYLPPSTKSDEGLAMNAEIVAKTAIETTEIKASGYRLRLYHK